MGGRERKAYGFAFAKKILRESLQPPIDSLSALEIFSNTPLFREKSDALIKAGAREEKSMEEVRTEYIMEILRKVNGNRGEAARILKLTPKTLYRFEKNLTSVKS
jgi:DNA-binding NtrC family response regulator